jgi:Putative amidoligase enzyme.
MSSYLDAIIATSEKMNADQQVRRYGFEIESPSVGTVAQLLADRGFEATHDGSVDTADCVCDCYECEEHACDCRNCDTNNGYSSDPEHCSTCQANEASSVVLRNHAPSEIREALSYLDEDFQGPSYGDLWGHHVHVEARDLSISQLLSVVKLGAKASKLMPDLFGRDWNKYAKQTDADTFAEIESGHFAKMSEVNLYNIMQFKSRYGHEPAKYEIGNDGYVNSKSTIEFRLFNTTADASLIFARVAICRAIVSTAKTSGMYWALNAKTPTQFLNAIEFGRH